MVTVAGGVFCLIKKHADQLLTGSSLSGAITLCSSSSHNKQDQLRKMENFSAMK